jgi:hypothetical protein
MAQLLELRPKDQVVVDPTYLDSLCRCMGSRVAEAYVMEKVEEISDRLAGIDDVHRRSLPPLIQAEALRIAQLSGEIGLVSLARVARDLAGAAALGDVAAYRAVWQRLVRIGDRSLAQVWEAPGLSM